MAKTKTAFFCQNCGTQYPRWTGQCTSCKAWNTIVEEIVQKAETRSWRTQDSPNRQANRPLRIPEIPQGAEERMDSMDQEFNRVLGGGLVPGSLVLLGGEPGSGKSTLLLQIALKLPYKTLYVSGEESQRQIKMRAERIGPSSENCYILTETKTQHIFQQLSELRPELLIID